MDYRIEQLINAAAGHHPFVDWVMVHAASWGEPIFIAAVVVWFFIGWARGLARDRQGAITALIGAGVGLLINQIISHIWYRPRPFVTHPDSVTVLLNHARDASFPSDHASAGFAIAFVVFAFHRRVGIVALLFALLMCYARVYVGSHYPGDVAAGFVIGLVVAVVLVQWLGPVTLAIRQLVDRVIVTLRLPLAQH